MSSRDDNRIQEENRPGSQIDTSGYEKTLRTSRRPGGAGRRRPDRDEEGWDDYEPEEVRSIPKKKGRGGRILFWIIFVEVMAVACGVAYLYISRGNPDVDDLQIYKQYDVKFVINSDAHRPRYVGRFAESLSLAMEAGIDPERIVNIQKR